MNRPDSVAERMKVSQVEVWGEQHFSAKGRGARGDGGVMGEDEANCRGIGVGRQLWIFSEASQLELSSSKKNKLVKKFHTYTVLCLVIAPTLFNVVSISNTWRHENMKIFKRKYFDNFL